MGAFVDDVPVRFAAVALGTGASVDGDGLHAAVLKDVADFRGVDGLVVPADAEARVQPLCGYYSRACLPVLEGQLNKGVMSITQILKSGDLKVHVVNAGKADMDPSAFLNVNDRKSLHQVSVQLEKHGTFGRH